MASHDDYHPGSSVCTIMVREEELCDDEFFPLASELCGITSNTALRKTNNTNHLFVIKQNLL
jgi:hypothetical protein